MDIKSKSKSKKIKDIKLPDIHKKISSKNTGKCTSMACVLEYPETQDDIISIIRNANNLGISKLFVVTDKFNIDVIHKTDITPSSFQVDIKVFPNLTFCFDHLETNKYTSFVVTLSKIDLPSISNNGLEDYKWGYHRKIAIWFSCGTKEISRITIHRFKRCIQVSKLGRDVNDNLNLDSCTAIVLHWIAHDRRKSKLKQIEKRQLLNKLKQVDENLYHYQHIDNLNKINPVSSIISEDSSDI